MTGGSERPGFARALYALALLSGVAALVYEVTWARMLSLTFGSTTLAASTVVAAFMGGMGVGAWGYHRLQDRLGSPLLLYGALEIGIAVTTALLTAAFAGLPEAVAWLSTYLPETLWMGALRFVLVFALLLVPAALMGATYPALCSVLIRSRAGVDHHLGMIYGLNTVGAALGACVAGLFLIERFGLSGSVHLGNLLNLAVGAVALGLRARTPGGAEAALGPASAERIETSLPYWVTGCVLFGSGMTTLGYEILWFRGLRYLVGNSTYALTIILAVFLLGLGLGALCFRRASRRPEPERDLGLVQLGIGVLALVTLGAEAWILGRPEWTSRVSVYQETLGALPWWGKLAFHSGLSLVLMLPATILMGLSFPLASRLFLGNVRRLSARVGGAYLLSNLGSIVGSLGAAVLLLPLLGSVGGTRALALVNLGLGALVLRRRGSFGPLGWGAVALVAALQLVLPGTLRFDGPGRGSEQHLAGKLLFQEEGDLGTVQVRAHPRRDGVRGMSIDGTVIGISRGWRYALYSKQILLAHLPMVLDTRTRRTLNIGLGSASTLEATASHPEVELADCVEINGAVARGVRFFQEAQILEDPRVRLFVDDASHFLLRQRLQYDLIISDGKQAVDYSGNAKLLSRDFYQHALQRLAPEGLFVQWIPLGSLSHDFRIILRTFSDVFPEVEIFFDAPASVLFVGSRTSIHDRPHMNEERFQSVRAGKDLERFGIPSVEAFLSRWVASRAQVQAVVGPGVINTWDHTTMEFSPYKASREDFVRANAENLRLLIEIGRSGSSPAGAVFASPESPFGRSSALLRTAYLALMDHDPERAQELVVEAVGVNPADPRALRMLEELSRD